MARAGFVAVVVVALVIRLAFLAAVNPFGWSQDEMVKYSFPDAREYHQLAVKFTKDLKGGILQPFIKFNLLYKTPAYPAFISLVYSTAGLRFWLVMLIQALMDTAVCAMVYALASRLTSNRYAPPISALFYALDPLPIYYPTMLMTEPLFGLFTVAGIYCLVVAESRGWQLRYVFSAGVLLGGATLVRYIGAYLPVVLVAIVLGSMRLGGVGWGRTIFVVLLLVFSYMAALAPWQYRNYVVYGYYSLGTYLGTNMCYFNAGHIIGMSENKTFPASGLQCRIKDETNPLAAADRRFYIGLATILDRPDEYAGEHMRGIVELFTNRPSLVPKRIWMMYGKIFGGYGVVERDFKSSVKAYIAALVAAQVLASIVALRGLRREMRSAFTAAVLIGAIAYFLNATGIYGASTFIDRYPFPILPFMSITAGAGVAYLLAAAKHAAEKRRGKCEAGVTGECAPVNATNQRP